MKSKINLLPFIIGITFLLFISCSTVGKNMPLSSNEIVIGTIQTTFIARNTWLSKNETINMQVYIKLLEAAAMKYIGEIDIRDIVWVTGKKINPLDTEISATAKVIRVNSYEN